MRKFGSLLLIVFLCFGAIKPATAGDACTFGTKCATAAPLKITFDRIEARELLGGLGSSNGTLGTITEFFVNEETMPLVYLNGDQTNVFKDKTITVADGKICTTGASPTCRPCDKCINTPDKTALYDENNGAPGRERLRYTLPLGAITTQTAAKTGSNDGPIPVEFSVPQTGGKSPLTLAAQGLNTSTTQWATGQYHDKIYVFSNTSDKKPYLCSETTYSLNCLPCTDCDAKAAELAPYSTPNQ